jgi:hypothetical protein
MTDEMLKRATAYVLISTTPRPCLSDRHCIHFGRGAGRYIQPAYPFAPSSMSDEMAPYASTHACLTSGVHASPK